MSERINRKLVLCVEGEDREFVEDLAERLYSDMVRHVEEFQDYDPEKTVSFELLFEDDAWDEEEE